MHWMPMRPQYWPPYSPGVGPGGSHTRQGPASKAPASLPGSSPPIPPPMPEPPVAPPVPPPPPVVDVPPPLPPLPVVRSLGGVESPQPLMSTRTANDKRLEAHLNLMGDSPCCVCLRSG